MGSEGPKSVVIHVTGFKKFNVFATNPTETLVSNLRNYVEKTGLPPGVSLGSCTILETAGDGALPTLQKLLESSVTSQSKSGSIDVVWLHLGLNGAASKFAIEKQAVNEATFSCPDELGWQPKRLPIVAEDGEITRIRETSCSIDAIVEFLNKINGYDATISDDAGRFVCNYVYYHSLRFAELKGHKSLFVHVPPFSRINEETQMQFMGALLERLPIVAEDGEITRIRETSCFIDAILEFLNKINGCDATISDDAGRFVCNYVYYHSLRFAELKGHKSLFVHVPPFSRINEETQMQFIGALLEAIAFSC